MIYKYLSLSLSYIQNSDSSNSLSSSSSLSFPSKQFSAMFLCSSRLGYGRIWVLAGTGSLLHDNYCSAYTGILMQNLESGILLKLHWSATHPSSVLDRFVSPLTWFGLLKSLASCVVEMEIHQTLSQEVHQR